MAPWWAVSAERETEVQGANGLYCKGGTGTDLGLVVPSETVSWPWNPGCSGVGGEGDRGPVRKRKQRGVYCPPPQEEQYVCVNETRAHLT